MVVKILVENFSIFRVCSLIFLAEKVMSFSIVLLRVTHLTFCFLLPSFISLFFHADFFFLPIYSLSLSPPCRFTFLFFPSFRLSTILSAPHCICTFVYSVPCCQLKLRNLIPREKNLLDKLSTSNAIVTITMTKIKNPESS